MIHRYRYQHFISFLTCLGALTGKMIEGYEKESCIIENQDVVKLPIRWKNAEVLPTGVPVRLRFHLQNGDLFSYVID
jgi:hypothetical protein